MKQTGGPAGRRALAVAATGALLVLLAASLAAAVRIGTVDVSFHDVYGVIFYKTLGLGDEAYGSGSLSDIVWYIRLPRLILAMSVGMGLSVSGLTMQAVVRNPLADPYILGVSSGASLGATLAILLGVGAAFGGGYVGAVAFMGAFLAAMTVVALANVGGRATSVKLILSGTAVAAVCGAVSNFLLYVINTSGGVLEAVVRWTLGSCAGAEWGSNLIMLAVSAAGTLFFWTQARTMNLMLLGDDTAVTLGTDLHASRIVFLVVSSLMVGFAVYTSGIIGFVGLIVPHVARMIFGPDHKYLVPISSLMGGVFMLWADVLCRVLIPRKELPIGILTAMIGAPIFIWLMIRRSYGFGGGEKG